MVVVVAVAARHLHRRRLGRVNRVAHRLGADADAGDERDERRDEGLLLAAADRGRESGLDISEAELSPMLVESEAQA